MGRPRFLAENFFNEIMFPGHVLVGSHEIAGNEVFRIGAARRAARNFWTGGATNTEYTATVTCDRTRAADMVVIDRNSNLAGHELLVEASNDNFSTWSTVVDVTLPTTVTYNRRLGTRPGALTPEGAWLLHFPLEAARYWRLRIPAMGTGLKPQIGGAWLGKSVQFERGPLLPWGDARQRLAYDEIVSPSLWAAAARKAKRRESGETPIRIPLHFTEEELAEYHFNSLYFTGEFMWLVTNDSRAERSLLVYAPSGVHGITWGELRWPVLTVPWREHEPKQN